MDQSGNAAAQQIGRPADDGFDGFVPRGDGFGDFAAGDFVETGAAFFGEIRCLSPVDGLGGLGGNGQSAGQGLKGFATTAGIGFEGHVTDLHAGNA